MKISENLVIFSSLLVAYLHAGRPVIEKCQTQWFDGDDPSVAGDYECLSYLLKKYPGQICPKPIAIEAQTLSGVSASDTGESFLSYNATSGFACLNGDQKSGKCQDYRVRFTCPAEFCSKCRTQWFDRDNPGGTGDNEVLSRLLKKYPKQICRKPIAIEAQTLSGVSASDTGQIFRCYDATEGFVCVNKDQKSRKCQDYRVRFTCPTDFCSECNTQWFDRDDPSGTGDYEDLSNLRKNYTGQICPKPIAIEAQTLSGVSASDTGEIFRSCDASNGFVCVNKDQKSGKCQDYRVRFTCPAEFCSKCRTQWFDRDDPSVTGDYEGLSALLKKYPKQICPMPIAIEAQTLSGVSASDTGEIFRCYDATEGFTCVNKDQKSGKCRDYRVRFTCPTDFCSECNTQWFDRDDPSGTGDNEDLSWLRKNYPGQICPKPIAIEAQTLSGVPASDTGESFHNYDATNGFVCVNKDQKSGKCQDYRVRFTCPAEFCSKCRTQWFDRDNTGGTGDYEVLSTLLKKYPKQICPKPIAIEAQTLSGVSASDTGEIFRSYDATEGFTCVKKDQKSGKCQDYRVRFTCPTDFCSECNTQWFDRDDPSGTGDYEDLSNLRNNYTGQICPKPIAIEAQTLSGVSASDTGESFLSYDAANGFVCVNKDQKSGKCQDYRVRFTCPAESCSKCRTQWFDRDDPSGTGDYEGVSRLLKKYPKQICPMPIAIEAQTLSGVSASDTGEIFRCYDATEGFTCVNKDQKSGKCRDYRVRFTCPTDFCSECNTQWFDRDDPSGTGDNEDLSWLRKNYPGQICPKPIAIEAQTLSGVSASDTGESFHSYDATNGFVCVNKDQKSGKCQDYRVRFTCPAEFCSKCRTQWLDRDNPGGTGDYEVLSTLLKKYPKQICPKPIAIEAQTLSGVSASDTGEIFRSYDATEGFTCVKKDQKSGKCQDYRVRFTCPTDFCSECNTQWFDRDDPSGTGDNEDLSNLRNNYTGQICPKPIAIEAQTLSGVSASDTGESFLSYDAANGFVCVNKDQKSGKCQDYRVRFTCPAEFCSKCRTQWFDRDDPSVTGDYEVLSLLLKKHPRQICPKPIAIEAQTLSGVSASDTGEIFRSYDATEGFVCVSKDQKSGKCRDYRVRFTCPTDFCSVAEDALWRDLLPANWNQRHYCLRDSGFADWRHNPCINDTNGFACMNSQQRGGVCQDDQIRFTCPLQFYRQLRPKQSSARAALSAIQKIFAIPNLTIRLS